MFISCFLFLSLGCDEKSFINYQESSREEAIYKSQSLENFDKNVFYLSVSSLMEEYDVFFKYHFPVAPRVAESSDSFLAGKDFVHIIINKNKDGKLWLIFLKDTRPLEIVFKKELN